MKFARAGESLSAVFSVGVEKSSTSLLSTILVEVLNTIVRCMAHYNHFDDLQLSGDDSNTADTGNNSSSNASSKRKRGLARGLKPLPNGKKKKIGINSWGQPNQANPETNTYSSDIGFQVRMHLPIIYESFKDVPNDRIALVVKGLVECYDISHVAWFDLKEKNYRCLEKAKSKRTKENRAKLIASCTLGRTSMSITCHKLAELRNTMRKDPKSIRTRPNDVIAQVFNVIELIIEMYYYLSIYSYIHIYAKIWQREERWNSGYRRGHEHILSGKSLSHCQRE
ncbi:hypothetical protein GIB67_026340 [Kingdonia uniflora]|uniref:Uncharacterized protein n=1 Tax=Kingdonia uniflora TaxID=39325 RepID=A0A7J7P6E4_9MAGN|nr:hypothetical protein GIB67_026340 [Kingdonia uniflora]